MSSAALKEICPFIDPTERFVANLEDGSAFSATLTELRGSSTPGRGEIYVVIATSFHDGHAMTFTITFAKDALDTITSITDEDNSATLFLNNYKNPDNPTLQKAKAGTIQYALDLPTLKFSGKFNAPIEKADGSGTYLCNGEFDTILSQSPE